MNKYFYILAISFLSCSENSKVGRHPTDLSEIQLDLIREGAKTFPDQTQLSIAIIQNGAVSFYGIKRENDSLHRVSNQKSAFEIGSITKVLTSTILANFVLDNKIELDEDINGHIEVALKNGTRISFVQLANHTSGLPRLPANLNLSRVNAENPYQAYDEEKLESYLTNELELSSKAGIKYTYSNLGVGLLGYVLCKIDNAGYEELLEQYIFAKYDMSNTTTERMKVKKLVPGRSESGREVPNWDLSALEGAGAVLSTAEDLSKFAIAQFDASNLELTLTRKKTFHINQVSDVGLGWEIINRRSGAIWQKHNGGTGGYTSSIIIETSKKNGVVILSNVSAYSNKSDNIDDLSFALMGTLQ